MVGGKPDQVEARPIVELELIKKDPKESIGEYVYNTLKKNIINMNVKPGAKISETEIAGILGLSRTPIREAFIKLAQEGVLNILPQRGTYIAKIDLKQVEEARFIREALEKGVMGIAVQGISKEVQKALEKSIKLQKMYIDNDEFEAFLEEDEAFHKLIFKACEKERSWEVIEMVNTQYKRIRLLSFELHENLERVHQQHIAMYDAIVNKDLELGEKTINDHVKKILTDQLELQRRYPEYFVSEDE